SIARPWAGQCGLPLSGRFACGSPSLVDSMPDAEAWRRAESDERWPGGNERQSRRTIGSQAATSGDLEVAPDGRGPQDKAAGQGICMNLGDLPGLRYDPAVR